MVVQVAGVVDDTWTRASHLQTHLKEIKMRSRQPQHHTRASSTLLGEANIDLELTDALIPTRIRLRNGVSHG